MLLGDDRYLTNVLHRSSPRRRAICRHLSSTPPSSSLIIHAAGADRLGIVADVTALATGAAGNVGESVAGRLGLHYFSLMMLVDNIPLAQQTHLQAQICNVPELKSAVFSDTAPNATTRTSRPQIACMSYVTCSASYV